MFEKYLRPFLQRLFLNRLSSLLSFIPPLLLTLLGCITGISAAFMIAFHHLIAGFCLLLLSGLFDGVDGTVARLTKKSSSLGAAYDILADRIVEFSLIVAFYTIHQTPYLALFMLGSVLICITSFLVVGIFAENESHKGFYYSPGLVERGEAFVFFALMLFLPHYFEFLAILFSTLVFLTAFMRMIQFTFQCKSGKRYSKESLR